MPKSQIDGTALAAAVVASAFGFFLLGGPYFWMASIAGLSLALVLLSFDREGYRSVFESIGFSAVLALAFALAAATPIAWLRSNHVEGATFAGPVTGDWLPYVWIGVTILLAAIDRARMSGRIDYTPAIQQRVVSLRPPAPPPIPTGEPVRPPVSPAEPPAPPVTPRPTFTRPSFSEAAPEPPVPPATPPVAPQVIERTAEPAPVPQATPAPPAPPAPQAVAIPPGKEATIYVSLVGEGLNVLRAVRAEHVGRDFYKIAEEMPDGETWQFGPGQVVRCRKKNLSSGKAMVAIEEAPRAQ
ncbi:MAG TPA: hypothetical protein VKX25_06085 [Bryobacteraceae bacterium]|jgi:hypothetical protein|nr:hypothetical protein [Bryobacteraceae bacterium]